MEKLTDYKLNLEINNSSDSLKYNVIVKNLGSGPYQSAIHLESARLQSFKYNSVFSNSPYNVGIGGNFDIYYLDDNYHGTTDSLKILSGFYDFYEQSSLPVLLPGNYLEYPLNECHGFVWKVSINGIDPQEEYLDPIGSELLRFDVYFNRAMDTTYIPFLTFGVREPFTQSIVSDNASWSLDSTVWTAYKTIGLETGDGINTIRVARTILG